MILNRTILIISWIWGVFLSLAKETSQTGLKRLSQDLTTVYFIGDLHADYECAKQWVEATGLMDLSAKPYKWLGTAKDGLVFMGDYVDKGSSSSSVLSLVREIQQTFSDNVVTILGNHDFFLILDLTLQFNAENPHPLGHPFYEYVYSFMHVEEYYQSHFTANRSDDEELLGAILQGLQNVYDADKEGEIHLCAPYCLNADQMDFFHVIPPFSQDPSLAERARERLETWRKEYAEGLYNSGLLSWLVQQPLVAQVADALVVHGGVSQNLLNYIQYNNNRDPKGFERLADALNQVTNQAFVNFFERHQHEFVGPNSIPSRDFEGISLEAILDMVQHRGYFKQNGCQEVNHVLTALSTVGEGETKDDLERIVVGHTPFDDAAQHCHGKLLAADSSLSRPFRAHGNMYCPISRDLDRYKGNSICRKHHNEFCEGSITRMRRSTPKDSWPNTMEIMTLDELLTERANQMSKETLVDGNETSQTDEL